jgi:hypothetical protein
MDRGNLARMTAFIGVADQRAFEPRGIAYWRHALDARRYHVCCNSVATFVHEAASFARYSFWVLHTFR